MTVGIIIATITILGVIDRLFLGSRVKRLEEQSARMSGEIIAIVVILKVLGDNRASAEELSKVRDAIRKLKI